VVSTRKCKIYVTDKFWFQSRNRVLGGFNAEWENAQPIIERFQSRNRVLGGFNGVGKTSPSLGGKKFQSRNRVLGGFNV
jgi:hypothetical protein